MKLQFSAFFLLAACGTTTPNKVEAPQKPTCTTTVVEDGVLIVCGDSEPIVIKNGRNGETVVGPQGSVGKQGSAGSQGSQGSVGGAGSQGAQGSQGTAGTNGSSCSIEQYTNGALITCTDGTMAAIYNGSVGAQGETGSQGAQGSQGETGSTGETGQQGAQGTAATESAFQIVEVIDPCGKQPGFNEVLLRTADNKIIAHYADGAKQFLTILVPGNFVTTDITPCYFTVTEDMQVINQHL